MVPDERNQWEQLRPTGVELRDFGTDGDFEVLRVEDVKIDKGARYYKVIWEPHEVGSRMSDVTWEPEVHLQHLSHKVAGFWRSRKGQLRKTQGLKESCRRERYTASYQQSCSSLDRWSGGGRGTWPRETSRPGTLHPSFCHTSNKALTCKIAPTP